GKIKITNSTFQENANFALQAHDGANLSGFSKNTFTKNGVPMWVEPDNIGQMAGTSSFVDNDTNSVFMSFGNLATVTVDQTWQDIGVPYRITDRTFVKAKLTLEAGVTVEFSEGSSLRVKADNGGLQTQGEEGAEVVFRGVEPVQAYWQGISIETN